MHQDTIFLKLSLHELEEPREILVHVLCGGIKKIVDLVVDSFVILEVVHLRRGCHN